MSKGRKVNLFIDPESGAKLCFNCAFSRKTKQLDCNIQLVKYHTIDDREYIMCEDCGRSLDNTIEK